MSNFTLQKFQSGSHFARLRERGLTPGHFKVLGWLDPAQPRPMGVLADALGIDNSQVTWLVDRLEEQGLVERLVLPTDRRVKTIALTPEGTAFRLHMLEEVNEPPEELQALDAATLEALREQLEKLPVSPGWWERR